MADTQVLDRTKRATATLGANNEKRSVAKTANILCCDISGSMTDPIGRGDTRPKITGLKESATPFISNLPESCYLSIIVFSDTARVIYELQPLSNKLSLVPMIQKIGAGGSTAMKEALILTRQQFQKSLANYTKRLFLLTDGMPNEDPTAEADLLKKEGVQITTLGFGDGMEIDENLMSRLASVSVAGKPLYEFCLDAKNLTAFLKKQTQTITY